MKEGSTKTNVKKPMPGTEKGPPPPRVSPAMNKPDHLTEAKLKTKPGYDREYKDITDKSSKLHDRPLHPDLKVIIDENKEIDKLLQSSTEKEYMMEYIGKQIRTTDNKGWKQFALFYTETGGRTWRRVASDPERTYEDKDGQLIYRQDTLLISLKKFFQKVMSFRIKFYYTVIK